MRAAVRLVWLALALTLAVAALALAMARARWNATSEALRAQLAREARPPAAARYSESELAALPAPVARYLRAALRPGEPVAWRVRVTWRGEFNVGTPGHDRWRPFTAVQEFVPGAPGFVWDARVAMAPGMPVYVRDAFVGGAGSMRAAVLGIVPVVSSHGTPEIAKASLQRYLGECEWFPTALLPGQGVTWSAIDSTRARATVAGGATTASLEFRFGPDGLPSSLFAPDRAYDDGRHSVVARPWQCRNLGFDERSGVRIPADAVVEWLLPGGPFAYWRARAERIDIDDHSTGR